MAAARLMTIRRRGARQDVGDDGRRSSRRGLSLVTRRRRRGGGPPRPSAGACPGRGRRRKPKTDTSLPWPCRGNAAARPGRFPGRRENGVIDHDSAARPGRPVPWPGAAGAARRAAILPGQARYRPARRPPPAGWKRCWPTRGPDHGSAVRRHQTERLARPRCIQMLGGPQSPPGASSAWPMA